MRIEGRRSPALDAIIGEDPALKAALARAALVAPTATPVLVTGESGTGKELIARALHELGPNAAGPFVAVNCGALPRELAESELFGHERGAFTGAAGAPGRLVRGGVRGNAGARRDRRASAGPAAQAAARARDRAAAARGRRGRDQRARARRRDDVARPARRRQPALLPRRPLLSARRVLRTDAAAARAPRRYPVAGGAFPARDLRRDRGAASRCVRAGGAGDGGISRQRARAAQHHPAGGHPDRAACRRPHRRRRAGAAAVIGVPARRGSERATGGRAAGARRAARRAAVARRRDPHSAGARSTRSSASCSGGRCAGTTAAGGAPHAPSTSPAPPSARR